MPTQTYYLRGGPCGGQTGDLTPNQPAPPYIDCGGDRYKKDASVPRVNGSLVYKDAGKAPGTVVTGGTPHTHKGWEDLRHSFNINMVHKLDASQKITSSALRNLHRIHRVRP